MEAILTKAQQGAIAVLRVATGIVFLTAGLEKFLGAEPFSAAGFLKGPRRASRTWARPPKASSTTRPRLLGQPRRERDAHADRQLAGRGG
jgi:uncharacterized membrane protein YphA (DoxX/SURF4 family)